MDTEHINSKNKPRRAIFQVLALKHSRLFRTKTIYHLLDPFQLVTPHFWFHSKDNNSLHCSAEQISVTFIQH